MLEQFKNSFVLVNNEIEIKRNTVDRVDVSMDKAHHLGLIINEILSNAIKHSFDKFDSQKIIFVEIKKVKSLLEFKIWNNGHKVDKAKFEGSKSFGLTLINHLLANFESQISLFNKNQYTGFKFSVPI